MKRLIRRPRFTGVALSVLVLMVAPIAACGGGGSGTTYTPPPIPISPCTVTQQTPTAFRGGGGFDARSIPAARTLPGSEWDSGYTIVPLVTQVTLSQPTSGQIQGAHVAQRGSLAASVGHLNRNVSSPLCSGTVPVSCTQGVMLGGGFDIRSASGVSVVASYPSSANSWTVTILDGNSATQTVMLYTGCVTPNKGYPSLKITIFNTGPVKPHGHPPDVAVATCPSESGLALDGGFMLNLPKNLPQDATVNVIASYPTMSPAPAPTPTPSGGATPKYDEWAVQAYTSSGDVSEVAYVECETTSSGTYPVDVQFSSLTVASNSSRQAGIPNSMCPPNYALTGGGFSTNDTGDPAADTAMSFQLDNGMFGSGYLKQWDVAAFNSDTTHSHSATVYAVCV